MGHRRTWGCAILVVGLLVLKSATGYAAPPGPSNAEPSPHLGYGVNLRYLSNLDSIFPPLGFDWIKVYERFDTMPLERLPYHVLYRIDISHGDRWSWQDGRLRPNLDRIRADVRAIAQEGLGLVDAYEIGNEPNMEWQWENQPPDPADYVAVLRVAYEEIKAVDPGAIVVSGGLGPVGRIDNTCSPNPQCWCTANSGQTYSGNNCHAMDERIYAQEMFERGAGDYFDAFGYHPVGFAYEPERALEDLPPDDNGNGFAFRGAEVMRAIMETYDLGDKPIWATEFGWLRDPSEDGYGWCHGEDVFANGEWYDLPEVTQANYLTRSFHYADEHWPWMGAMFIWNLDFQMQYDVCDPGRYFAVRKENGTYEGAAALAYSALASMPKRPAVFGPQMVVTPTMLSFEADADVPRVYTGTLTPLNAGYGTFTWTATVASGMTLTPTLAITQGLQGEPMTVTVDSGDYEAGAYTGTITVTSSVPHVTGVPQTISVTLRVVSYPPRLTVTPSALNFLADIDMPGVFTGTLLPQNVGGSVLTWTATVEQGMRSVGGGTLGVQVTPTLVTTMGLQGDPLTVTLDSTGYALGTFTGTLAVDATTTDVLDAPWVVPVTLRVVPEVYRVYLPVTLRNAR